MVILDKREELLELVDKNTLRKVKNSRDYVVKNEDGEMLVSFRWIDHSGVMIYATAEENSLWTGSSKVREIARSIDSSKENELFDFFIAIGTEDLSKLDKFDDRIISFEEKLFADKGVSGNYFEELHTFRKEGWNKRRYFERMEILTTELAKADSTYSFIDNKYDKLLNHVVRTQEYLDQIRQAYEAQIGIEQNNLMKFFTVITSIFLPLSLIAGWYGMNLMMPEVNWIYSYPFVIAISLAIIAVMLWLFRKNKWL